jgi:hypothetical protein
LLVFTPHQQTFASSSQRTFTISDVITYSFNLFVWNHKNDNNLFVICLSETENLILYLALLSFKFSLMKREPLKTAGQDIHR